MLQITIIFAMATLFISLERIFPGRELPNTKGWYLRAIFLNLCQFSIVFLSGATWNRWFSQYPLFHFADFTNSILEGFFYWFVGTFVFYWWHRLRHKDGWWQIFHQVHHSPSRIETLTSFYKHPIEMIVNSILISFIIFFVFGGSIEAAGWYNVFAVGGEFFYHTNLKSPHWFGYFIQRPEQHSIHHELGVHSFNFGDITWWDRLFGTFRDTEKFSKNCGFDKNKERELLKMLECKDVN